MLSLLVFKNGKNKRRFHFNFKIRIFFLKDADEVEKSFRTICKSVFSIEHGGHIYYAGRYKTA